MTQPKDNPQDHGCGFEWCENTKGSHEREHFQLGKFVPATGKSLYGIGYTNRDPHREELLTIGVGVRFNEDLDPAPNIFLNVHGGEPYTDEDCHLRLDEAVLFYNALGTSLAAGHQRHQFGSGHDHSLLHAERPVTDHIAEGPCLTGRCAFGEPCRCNFYRGWTVDWPSRRGEPVSVQLMRRRMASYRCPRLETGHRDPLSRVMR